MGSGYSIGDASSTVQVLGSLHVPGQSASSGLVLNSTNMLTSVTLTNGQMLIGSTGNAPVAGTIASTAHQTTVTAGVGTLTIGTAQNIDTTSTPTFASQTLNAASNQLLLQPGGSGNSFQFTCTNPVANRTITLPDPGASANLVLTQGTQTLAGATTFSAATTFTAATNQVNHKLTSLT